MERLQIFPELLKEAKEKRLTENFAHVSILKITKIKHLYSLLCFCCYFTQLQQLLIIHLLAFLLPKCIKCHQNCRVLEAMSPPTGQGRGRVTCKPAGLSHQNLCCLVDHVITKPANQTSRSLVIARPAGACHHSQQTLLLEWLCGYSIGAPTI